MCLHKRRYGEHQRRMPTKEMCDDIITSYQLQQIYKQPTRKKHIAEVETILQEEYYDVFGAEHYKLISDFLSIANHRTKSRIFNQVLMHKLIYYIHYPQQYGNEFEQFAIPWFYNLLLRMRRVILRDIGKKTGIEYKYSYNPKTQGLYPFPKSLEVWSVRKITNKLYEVYYGEAIKAYDKRDIVPRLRFV